MSETRWLDDQESRAWRGLHRMLVRLGAQLNRDLLRQSGLSFSDYEVLVHLSETADRRLRSFELGDALQWEKSRLSHHLTRMERRGLVTRAQCKTDARGAFIVLTDEGLAAIRSAAPHHVEDVRRYFVDVLTPAQLDGMTEISQAVLARLDDVGESSGSEELTSADVP